MFLDKNPPPPKIGDVYRGPPVEYNAKSGLYHVRAVVDPEEVEKYGWFYYVVFKFWTQRKGWRYYMVDAFALGFGTYKFERAGEEEDTKEEKTLAVVLNEEETLVVNKAVIGEEEKQVG